MPKFAVRVKDGERGRDGKPSVGPVYRNPIAEHQFPPLNPEFRTCWDIFRSSAEKYPHNNMLGWRQMETNGKWGPYRWKTYEQVYEETVHAASALRAHGFVPEDRIGIYGVNCPQWIVAMEVCNAQSFICVPLYDTLGSGAVNYILGHAEIGVVFVQDKKIKHLLDPECTHARKLKLIVSFTSLTEEQKKEAADMGISACSWNEFLDMGRRNPWEIFPPQASSICTIMYTSGTSGEPKGVILTHEYVAMTVNGIEIFLEQFEDKMTVNDVYISFLPLAHILDRMIEEFFFRKGASVGYYHGEFNELQEDLVALKPTFMAGVPRVFERIHEGVLKALEELNWRRRGIFHLLYKQKLFWMNRGYKHKHASPVADLLAFRKVKNRLGGRLRLIVSGGAALSSEIEEFLRVTSCAFVLQGYGLTESCGLSTVGYPDEMCLMGTVGAPSVYTEIRLEEVPEMGYDPLGEPPRGEICLRSPVSFKGYYKNPELTQEVTTDGWFHTGDIGEITPEGALKIIDRKKNLIKMSQGEYVAVEYLEKVYCITPIVEDIWVYGDSFKSMLVAVVVPNQDNTQKWGHQNGYKGSFLELCSLPQLKDHILVELQATAERNKLRGFERIKGIAIEPEMFESGENELVTATLKKRRDRFLKRYKAEIAGIYQKLAEAKSAPQ